MACYLRVYGENLDVNALVCALGISTSKVWEKGAPRFKSNPKKLNLNSGLNIQISNAEWHEFEKQKAEAIEYLTLHQDVLSKVVSYPGVEGGYLDFGIEWRDVPVQSDSFPPELVKLAGNTGLGLELSQYPPDGDRNET